MWELGEATVHPGGVDPEICVWGELRHLGDARSGRRCGSCPCFSPVRNGTRCSGHPCQSQPVVSSTVFGTFSGLELGFLSLFFGCTEEEGGGDCDGETGWAQHRLSQLEEGVETVSERPQGVVGTGPRTRRERLCQKHFS